VRNARVDAKLEQLRLQTTPYVVRRGNIDISVLPGVYPTSEVSELIVEALDDPVIGIRKGDRILDYGCGTGFLAIQAAFRSGHVTAIDINPQAVECVQLNVKKFQLLHLVDVRLSKELDAIRECETFNFILAGLPWDDSEPKDVLEMAMYDPGFKMRKALFGRGNKLLVPGGKILLTYADFVQKRQPIEALDERFTYEVVRERIIKGEKHYAVMAQIR
jgi:methylase of polypeptide subunit release factors